MNKKGWLIAAILAFIILLVWVGFDIVHKRSQVEIPANIEEDLKPINPIFDTSAL